MPARSLSARQLAALLGSEGWRRPVYADLAERVHLLAVDGRLADGLRLPAERDLAATLGLSRTTVTTAYGVLAEAGLIAARPGSGHFLRAPVTPSGRSPAAPFDDDAIVMTFTAAAAAPGVLGAYRTAMESLPELLSGHGYVPDGLPLLQERIAARYEARGLPTEPEQIVVTAGALAGLNLVAEALLEVGDRVLVESPTYFNALDLLRRRGARLVSAPVDDDGWDVPAVRAAVRQSAPRLAYLVPDFHNPTGQLMPADVRLEVGRLLRRERCVAVVDETLLELNLDGVELPPPLAAGLPDAFTLGSASKSFWGGLRIGWIRAPRAQVRALVERRASVDLGAPPFEQRVLVELLALPESARSAHLSRLREQRDTLARALSDQLPEWRVRLPAGGQTLWAELPTPVSSQLVARAAADGVILTPGHRFFAAGAGERHLRLPFTAPTAVLVEVVSRLARTWRSLGSDDRRGLPLPRRYDIGA